MAFTERSRPAREAVLAAARRAFATEGYERTTIRAVASDAGVDPAMVIRYFGSKEALFATAVEVDLHLPRLAGVAPEDRGKVLARHFVGLWDDEPTAGILRVLLRSASTHEIAAERIRAVFAGQVLALAGPAGATPEGRQRAVRLSSYVLGTALCRYVVELPLLAELDAADLVDTMAPVIQAILDL